MDTNAAILAGLIRRAKAEIIVDAMAGRFAARPDQSEDGHISSFYDLHDYVDADEYGGAHDPEVMRLLQSILGFRETGDDDEPSAAFQEVILQFCDPMQQALDLWIRRGGLAAAVTRVESGFPIAPLRALDAGIPVFDFDVAELLGES